MRDVQKPRALRPGQTIGLVASSSALPEPERLPIAIAALESLGYHIKTADNCLARYGYLAGEDILRAEHINRMFADDTVDAVMCVRGGYGATRIVGRLAYDIIRANPKVFSGYSDVTALHSAILELAGLVTFHGLMAVPDFGNTENDAFSLRAFWRVTGDTKPAGILENPPEFTTRQTLIHGRAKGPLIGGNLTLVCASLGTPYAYDFDGALLFLEEINEKTYAVDRMLTQLKNAGVPDRVSGILLGEFTNCHPEHSGSALTLDQVFEDVLGDCGKPILSGIRCGHCTPKLTLPFGVQCAMDADAQTIEILEGAVV